MKSQSYSHLNSRNTSEMQAKGTAVKSAWGRKKELIQPNTTHTNQTNKTPTQHKPNQTNKHFEKNQPLGRSGFYLQTSAAKGADPSKQIVLNMDIPGYQRLFKTCSEAVIADPET